MSSCTAELKYRPDIDGLRAIAVVAVLFYHVGFSTVPGGYAGVDMFFVISGFLVTKIIFDQYVRGGFSFTAFYRRRALRILPALAVVLAFVLLVGWRVLPPSDYLGTSKAAVASSTFVSNFYFWRVGGYFDTELKLNPLLHTWSLAVEEHFYLVLPLFFAIMWRYGRHGLQGAVLLVLVVSFGLSVFFIERHQDEVFYFSPFRAWELAAGSFLAVFQAPRISRRIARESVALIALALVLIPFFVYGKTTIFPGNAAIPTVLGTVLLIHVGSSGQSTISQLLSTKPFVLVGLISYSLYLWHWPLVVFAKFWLGWDGQGGSVGWILLPLSVLVAYLSWRFVERPFRESRFTAVASWRVPALAASCVLALAGGMTILLSGGAPGRFGPIVQRLDSERTASIPFLECDGRAVTSSSPLDWCVLGAASDPARASVLIWGDSHALAWAPAFDVALKKLNLTAVYVPTSACPPMFHVLNSTTPRCEPQAKNVERYLETSDGIELVVLSASWAPYFDDSSAYRLVDGKGGSNSAIASRALGATVSELLERHRSVLVIGPVPGAPADVPLTRVTHVINRVPLPEPRLGSAFRSANAALFESLERISSTPGVSVVDVLPWFCMEDRCDYVHDGRSRYRDGHHLSRDGALMFSDRIEGALMNALITRDTSYVDRR